MLPSRGVLRSLPSARVTSSTSSISISRSPRRLGDGRNFGTSLRSTGAAAPWSALKTANSRLGGLAGTLAVSGTLQTRRGLSLWGSSNKQPTTPPATEAPAAAAAPTPPQPAVEPAPVQPAPVEPTAPIQPAAVDMASPVPPFPEPTIPEVDTASLLDGASLLDLPEQIGYLKTLGLDFGWGPSSMMQWIVEHVHVYSGMPWWGTIAATAILLRVAMFKPLLLAQDTSARMQLLTRKPKYNELRQAMQDAMSRRDNAAMMEARRDMSLMNKAAGVKPLRGMWSLVQVPFGYGMFRVLNGSASIPVPGLESGGLLWFTDLTVPDPLYLLPIAGPIAMFAMMKIAGKNATPQSQAQQKLMMYILGPITVLFTMYLPAAVQFYFFIAGGVGVVQNWLFNKPSIRHRLGLPAMPPPQPLHQTITTTRSDGTTYQAPRAAAAGSSGDGSLSGVIKGFQQTIHEAKGGAGDHIEAGRKLAAADEAKKMEERREKLEKQKFWQGKK